MSLLLSFPLAPCLTAAPGANKDLVQATLLADTTAARPGGSFLLGVRLKMKAHWHTYWANPGETGDATHIQMTGPAGFTFGDVQWPLPTKIATSAGVSYGYEDEVLLLVPVTIAADVAPAPNVAIAASVSWLSCNDTCIEGGAKLTITLPVAPQSKPDNQDLFQIWKNRLPVPPDNTAAAEALSEVDRPVPGEAAGTQSFTIHWKQSPAKVEWFPLSTRAVAIEDVAVKHEGLSTKVVYKTTIFKPAEVVDGKINSVLVFEDVKSRRVGITVPVVVANTN